MALFARLYPYKPVAGFTVRTYVADGKSWMGGESPPWTPISDAEADLLRPLKQDAMRAVSPPLFEIVDEEQIQARLAHEQAQRLANLGAAGGVPPDVLQRALLAQRRDAMTTPAVPVDLNSPTGAVWTGSLPARRRSAAVPTAQDAGLAGAAQTPPGRP